MKQYIYVIQDSDICGNSIRDQIFVNKTYTSTNQVLTENILIDMAASSMTDYFYVISTHKEIILLEEFNFTYKPQEWDSKYVHIWNNDSTIRLFNKKEVLNNPKYYTDSALVSGNVKLKNIEIKIYDYPIFDIVFLSYDEEYATDHYNLLLRRFPRAKRVHGVKGFFEAHRAAAELAKDNNSRMFYVVDADAVIDPLFNFDYKVSSFDRNSVHVWHSKNPVNDLEYGYGAVKLFPTDLLLNYKGSPIDFTTSVSDSLKVIPIVSNITAFNTDPFSAWKSGFRECAKLSSKIIKNQNDSETEKRLHTWCNVGYDREFGDFTIMGANAGAEFGEKYANQPETLKLINNFNWLEEQFNKN